MNLPVIMSSLPLWSPCLEDWYRTWVTGRRKMFKRTSNRIKEVVDKMLLSVVVRLSRTFLDDTRRGTAVVKIHFVMRQCVSLDHLNL